MMCFLFEADLFSIFLMILSPLSLSLMTVIRQAIEKPINQFTLLLYGNGINLVLLIGFTLFSGKVGQLFSINLFTYRVLFNFKWSNRDWRSPIVKFYRSPGTSLVPNNQMVERNNSCHRWTHSGTSSGCVRIASTGSGPLRIVGNCWHFVVC